ncbi:MAG: hypothetical protein A2283_17095 [Lentisphaerae bacterium RIFOXYA12_FULL_48_11]|nr:MAG: hypothetical protein A2283_17095 [Lentisphaerae bacterium RIFOXYA12_FULL_48_11]
MVAGVVFVVILAWPVENWLEYREKHASGKKLPDAVYLVAGSIDQDRRIDALINFLSFSITNSAAKDTGIIVLVGNDRLKSRWSREEQTNLTRAEWGVKILQNMLKMKIRTAGAGLLQKEPAARVEIVPGKFGGTDGEMEALGSYLWNHKEIKRLVLVTSPFHVRRTLQRLSMYQPNVVAVEVVTAKEEWTDRAPWTVLGEIVKMGRDSLGFSRVPLLSRRVR